MILAATSSQYTVHWSRLSMCTDGLLQDISQSLTKTFPTRKWHNNWMDCKMSTHTSLLNITWFAGLRYPSKHSFIFWANISKHPLKTVWLKHDVLQFLGLHCSVSQGSHLMSQATFHNFSKILSWTWTRLLHRLQSCSCKNVWIWFQGLYWIMRIVMRL